jgi:predicted SAM-dependent methyltransferase
MNRHFSNFLKQLLPGFVLSFLKQILNRFKEIRSKIYIQRLLKDTEEICLEIGSGEKRGQGQWITLDVTKGCDLYWDLTRGIPFPDESLTKIYSSHLFEHLSFKEGQLLLAECIRTLKQDGLFSICVPDARLYIEAYMGKEDLDSTQFFRHKSAYNNLSRIDYLNYVAYMDGEHKHMFDEENMLAILKAQNFKDVHLRDFDPMLDTPDRDFESIYAEARK